MVSSEILLCLSAFAVVHRPVFTWIGSLDLSILYWGVVFQIPWHLEATRTVPGKMVKNEGKGKGSRDAKRRDRIVGFSLFRS